MRRTLENVGSISLLPIVMPIFTQISTRQILSKTLLNFSRSCMRLSHHETSSYKRSIMLKSSIIGLFNLIIERVLM